MPPIISKEEMDAMNSCNESDDEPMSTEMLEYIHKGIQYHPNLNKREAHYKIRDRIKQGKLECKGALKTTLNIGKGLHKVFKTFVKGVSQYLPTWVNKEILAKINSKRDQEYNQK